MKRRALAAIAAAIFAVPATAQEDGAFVSFDVLKPEVAFEMAEAAMQYCRDNGYQVGVTVVDRFGVPQVFVRDRFAGLHVYETSFRKAWTAVSFRTNTTELDAATAPGEISQGIRQLSMALPLGGGLMVDGPTAMVAGIGVSGAPSPEIDDECAEAGIEAVADQIAF
ncbi:MAG: heme-binding protein [Alphaproteobacteria bacterium]|nr:heme-binding protein [Alphaproteobacteria bacterium]